MDEQAQAINHKLIRLFESLNEVLLHASPMIARSMGMSAEDQTLLGDITAQAASAKAKMEQRLRAPAKPKFVAVTVVPARTPAPKKTPAAPKKPVIKARSSFHSTHKQWSLDPSLTKAQITKILGVQPDSGGDGKVKANWDFYANGAPCGIWDYYGAKWSAYGPREVFEALGMAVVSR